MFDLANDSQIQVGAWFQQKAARTFPVWVWPARRLHWHLPQEAEWTWGVSVDKSSNVRNLHTDVKTQFETMLIILDTTIYWQRGWCICAFIWFLRRWKCFERTHWSFGSSQKGNSTHPFVVEIFRSCIQTLESSLTHWSDTNVCSSLRKVKGNSNFHCWDIQVSIQTLHWVTPMIAF